MGWFDEQIRLRKRNDEKIFEQSFHQLSDAVFGKRIMEGLDGKETRAKQAIYDVLAYYGAKAADLPEKITEMDEQIDYLCRPNGIMKRTVSLDPGWYRDSFGALIAVDKETGYPVALLQDKRSKYYFYNTDGELETVNRHNQERFEREAYVFYKPMPLRPMNVRDLLIFAFSLLTPKDFIIPAVMIGITSVIGLMIPELTKFIFGTVAMSGSMSLLIVTMIFLASVTIGRLLFNMVQTLAAAARTDRMKLQVDAAAMMRVLSLPAEFFRGNSSGSLSTQIGYVSQLCESVFSAVFDTSITTVFSLLYVVQIFRYARPLVFPALLVIVATVLATLIDIRIRTRISLEEMQQHSKENGLAFSLLDGIQKIKLAGAEKRAFSKWATAYSRYLVRRPVFVLINGTIVTAIGLIGTIAMYFIAFSNGISVADYYAFNSAYSMVMVAFVSMTSIVETLAQIAPLEEMIEPILSAEPELQEDKYNVTHLSGGIELSHVTFRYKESMPVVIDDLSLKIKPGEYVALVGSTGCGKSTLIRLMLGFETPQKGAVMYDGRSLESIDLKSLRRKIGTVTQDGKLFMGDIYSNIVITAPWLSLDDAWEAAEKAAIADDIRNMPMQMQTMISEGGGGISGGQKQRLMIARAIAPKPRILLFDEATSALDNITQKKVSESLDSLRCTRVVVAHRLSTIRNCDRILVLDKGKIVEQGTYEELIENRSFFYELVERQRLDVDTSGKN